MDICKRRFRHSENILQTFEKNYGQIEAKLNISTEK